MSWSRIIVAGLVAAFAAGCGGSGPTEVKVKSMTPEEEAKVAAEDKAVDDEERSGSGTAVAKKKRRS